MDYMSDVSMRGAPSITRTELNTPREQLQKLKNLLADEALTLCQHSMEVKDSFKEVAKALEILAQNSHFNKGQRRKCDGLRKAWDGLHTAYDTLLWDSRKVAGKARATVRDFVDMFIRYISNPKISAEAKNAELKKLDEARYCSLYSFHLCSAFFAHQKLEVDQESAQETSQNFLDLSDQVDRFRAAFQVAIDEFKNSTKDPGALAMSSEMEPLLEKIKLQIKALATLAAADLVTGGISDFFRAVFPCFWSKVENPHNAEEPREKNDAQERLDVSQGTQGNLLFDTPSDARTGLVKALQVAQKVIEDCTEDIGPKLSMFSKIWAAIRSDIQQIRENAEIASSNYESALFPGRVERLKELYSLLMEALEVYECHTSVNPWPQTRKNQWWPRRK
ncbi:hypothetical protein BV22DRAFT_1129808 [Leucogyrophana mollusca]|uniref:Uncharacterized protein n=1 Tax=Leucogyrophana mollusca TaxID=85980 RepID=A0ACB8BFH2_9AGAM|nr:hypothetical protein BV22DRAFT_1129808 [Leucogyrophana mollusca]